jgi:hypothetical protein
LSCALSLIVSFARPTIAEEGDEISPLHAVNPGLTLAERMIAAPNAENNTPLRRDDGPACT